MAIGVSAATAGRLVVQKMTDYHLHLAASDRYLAAHDTVRTVADLKRHRLVGYIPDMIFDRELDYLADLGVTRVPLASNSVSVQVNMIRQGGGVGVVHDFCACRRTWSAGASWPRRWPEAGILLDPPRGRPA